MKPEFIVQHEDAAGSVKASIKFTGSFNKDEIQKAVLFCVNNMTDGDDVEYLKDDHSKLYAGYITMLSLHKRNGKVMRLLLQGAHANRFVSFNYFNKK